MSVWTAAAPFVVGHRGGRGEGWPPENTLEAFDRARTQGALAVELDVRTSADGHAVVFHDPALTRMTRARDARLVHEAAAGALTAVDLGGGARIPRLADVLGWARDHGVGVNVEMKYDVPSRRDVARAAARAVRASGADVLFSSFDPLLLAMAAAIAPSVPRALLTHARQSPWASALQRVARPPLLSAVHLERVQVRPGAIEAYGRRRVRVGVWTVDSPIEARDLVRRGAAWIISDAPGEVLAALRDDDARYSHVTGSRIVPAGCA